MDNFADLKSAVANWMARGDLTGDAEDFIQLGEARLNRELDPVELDTTLTGVADSREIDVSALQMEKPIALFLQRDGLNEYEITQKAPGTFPYIEVSGLPRFYSFDQTAEKIIFERKLDAAYSFRLRFEQYFSLSESAPTNWLLTQHPDVYLAAVLVWGGLFIRDTPYASQFQGVLNSGITEVKSAIAQTKRGLLSVDDALQRIGSHTRVTVNSEWFY